MKSSSWPLGFSATGLAAGLSKKKGKKDMAIFLSHLPANGGAMLPQTATDATLHLLLGLMALAMAAMVAVIGQRA